MKGQSIKTSIQLRSRNSNKAFMALSFVSALLVRASPAFVQAVSPAEDVRKSNLPYKRIWTFGKGRRNIN